MATSADMTLLLYSGLSDDEFRRLRPLDGEVVRELLASWRTDRCIWSATYQHGSRIVQLRSVEGVLFTIGSDELATLSNNELLAGLRTSLAALN